MIIRQNVFNIYDILRYNNFRKAALLHTFFTSLSNAQKKEYSFASRMMQHGLLLCKKALDATVM